MAEHRYILQPYEGPSTRFECPVCLHKKKFTRYIDRESNELLSAECGKCDRVDNCGYHFTPGQFFSNHPDTKPKSYNFIAPVKIVKVVNYINPALMVRTLRSYSKNNLAQYFKQLFGEDTMMGVCDQYKLGTSNNGNKWPGASVFWQIDAVSKVRDGKIMLYEIETGRRCKDPNKKANWVSSILSYGKEKKFEADRCFFGEHLLTDTAKHIAIVESEKTAMIASVYMPDFIWIATGGVGNLRTLLQKCKSIKGRNVILFPDINAYDKWLTVANEFKAIAKFSVSNLLEKNATDQEREKGYDLADYLVKFPLSAFQKKDEGVTIKTNTEVIPVSRKSAPTANLNREPFKLWDIAECEAFFLTAILPVSLRIDKATNVFDVKLMVASHLEIIRENNGNPAYKPYLNRLLDLITHLKNKNLQTWNLHTTKSN